MVIPKLNVIAGLALLAVTLALGEEKVITFPPTSTTSSHSGTDQIVFGSQPDSSESFIFASAPLKYSAPLLLDSNDDEAIHVAAQTFAEDVFRVTGLRPSLYNDTLPEDESKAIVVGSVSSRLVRSLNGDVAYVDGLQGKWESFDVRVMEKPVKGVEEGLIVVGSARVSCKGVCKPIDDLVARHDFRSVHYVRTDGRLTFPLLGRCSRPCSSLDRFH